MWDLWRVWHDICECNNTIPVNSIIPNGMEFANEVVKVAGMKIEA